MGFINRILKRYQSLGFKTKLFISYIIIIIISMPIIGMGYYYKSSKIILQNTGDTILDLVKKSNESLNVRFNMIEDSAIQMHTDEDLFYFFKEAGFQNRKFSYDNDNKITKVLLKYFPFTQDTQDVYSVNLVTKKYIFGQNPWFWIPKTNYQNDKIYRIGQSAQDSLRWIPTYNLLTTYYSENKSNYEGSQNVFTAVRQINCSIIKNNILYQLDRNIERPVLAINFNANMLQKAFEESTNFEGSYYYVLSENGNVISRSPSAADISFKKSQLLKTVFLKESGTEYIYINGQKMLVCFDKMDSTGWMAIVFIPFAVLLKTMPSMFYYILLLTILIIMISIVFASFMSYRITLPIEKLLIGIKKIGEGNFKTRVEEVGTGELAYLIRKFNEMNEKIQRLIDENYNIKLKEFEAELKALNFQFNPHFLYNTLNIINWVSIQNNQLQISEMIVELSEMLEYTAKSDNKVVNFKEDVQYLKNYISIMTKRFVGKFTVQYDIDPKLYNYTVPKFFLQPFIENALIHGFEEMEAGGEIKISGRIQGNERWYCIEDNGKGINPAKIQAILEADAEPMETLKSIGITNINSKIKLIYGRQYGVEIISEVGKGTKVMIKLPLD